MEKKRQLSTGAADDFAQVTDNARSMVIPYGMHEKLGHIAYEAVHPAFLPAPGAPAMAREHGEETVGEIDRAVRIIAQDAFDHAVPILKERRNTLERGARETLTENEPRELLKPEPLASATGT